MSKVVGMREVELEGARLTAILLDSNITLQFGTEREAGIRIEVDIEHRAGLSGLVTVIHFDPYDSPIGAVTGLDTLGALVDVAVTRASVSEDGVLTIEFQDESLLTVPASTRYEAWSFSSLAGTVVSMPGGQVTEL